MTVSFQGGHPGGIAPSTQTTPKFAGRKFNIFAATVLVGGTGFFLKAVADRAPSLDQAALLPSSGEVSPTRSVLLVPSVTSLIFTPPRMYVVRQNIPTQSSPL